ncbi:MAG TPA: glycosyltransferase [Syntrophales bacterium]|nr:glycosyltransferase [Syntrophales bacterium]
MRYNAGSEVYSQTLCHELAKRHQVHVFTREEDSFAPDFQLRRECDSEVPGITLHVVNNPRYKDRYRDNNIDECFDSVLDEVKPDIVHIGHLNHLSTSLVMRAVSRRIPIVFTLHDYWLMCPRGQFMQMFPENPDDIWAVCDGQEDKKCAERCYARYFSGAVDEKERDLGYWTDWVTRRMKHVREITEMVDAFIAPARYLKERFQNDFGIPPKKIIYLDYGFECERLLQRHRKSEETFVFGYIGTHIPAKGIHDLIRAFGRLQGDARLRIWGRPRGQDTEALKRIANSIPPEMAERVDWFPEYRNQDITTDVFNHCDAIVVPSIWMENSPLVIHEAQQARLPVITADIGGMSEHVHHEVNGLLFHHRSVLSLSEQMQRFIDDPDFALRLGNRGYLFSDSGDIPSIEKHALLIEEIYEDVIARYRSEDGDQRSGPWRITFDTNPDLCNLQCIMCEQHSPYRGVLNKRKETRGTRVMNRDLIEKIIHEAVPFGLKEIIPSTMGEPLLYEHFDVFLHLCHRYNLKLNLTTNGTFPYRGASAWAELIVPVASDVKISWNGATKPTYEGIMIGSNWEKALENIREFIAVRDKYASMGKNRCQVTFQLTFLQKNVDELSDIVRLAAKLGVDRVKGHHLWVHSEEMRSQSMRRSKESIKHWNKAVIQVSEAAQRVLLPNGKKILLENFSLLDEKAVHDLAPGGPCPFLGKEAWISAEGRFDPCCAPDGLRRSLGDFGFLANKGLMEIWNGEDYKNLKKTYLNNDLCISCNMRKRTGDMA